MAKNESGEAVPEEDHKTETLGTLKIMVSAGTEEINKSHKRKFDEITEKLPVIEESVAKILKTNEDEKDGSVIYGESSVDDGTVSGLRHSAGMYDAPMVTRKCEEYLSKEWQKSLVQNLKSALRWNMEDLMNADLSGVTEVSDIEAIMEANHPEVDVSTVEALLQKISIDFSKE
ncbi:Protein CBG26791 [Caenorhabditis briggsae]|uniref:Protein CBG26791 n=1 Tax=Caenorhabditis briggsae TaxID=6238 RepID=B6IHA3_CAEBR|nr:Protein CBG26791 [Caenorhabditis briggsae]CAR99283.1 Protein CBG26791 [Caenorhabditis briggsae]